MKMKSIRILSPELKKNRLAAKVKIADIEDNIDVLRLNSLDEYDLARIKKYHSAWRFLKEEF